MDFFSEIESPINTKSGKNSTFPTSNHIKFGIRTFYRFSFNIPETFKKWIISLEENKSRKHTGDQLRTVIRQFYQPFFSQRNCQNIDLKNQNI